jgi:hypothetical protein
VPSPIIGTATPPKPPLPWRSQSQDTRSVEAVRAAGQEAQIRDHCPCRKPQSSPKVPSGQPERLCREVVDLRQRLAVVPPCRQQAFHLGRVGGFNEVPVEAGRAGPGQAGAFRPVTGASGWRFPLEMSCMVRAGAGMGREEGG